MADGAAAVDEREKWIAERLSMLADTVLVKDEIEIKLNERISRGGQGVVYKGTLNNGSSVQCFAVKLLVAVPERYEEAVLEARREYERLDRVNDDHVVKPLTYGEGRVGDLRFPWLAMDFVAGRTLEDEVYHGALARCTPANCWPVIRELCKGVIATQNVEVLHRDIKPKNVIVRQVAPGEWKVVLVDFGFARRNPRSAEDTEYSISSERLGGSVGWSAPEQWVVQRSTKAADVYALAVVVTFVLTGATPRDMSDLPPNVRRTPGAIDVRVGTWEPVLHRALALEPAERYQSAKEFLDALEDAYPRLPSLGDVEVRTSDSLPAPGSSIAVSPVLDSNIGEPASPNNSAEVTDEAGVPIPLTRFRLSSVDDPQAPQAATSRKNADHVASGNVYEEPDETTRTMPISRNLRRRSAATSRPTVLVSVVIAVFALISWRAVAQHQPQDHLGKVRQDREESDASVGTALQRTTSAFTDDGGVDAPIQVRPEVGVDAHVDGPRGSTTPPRHRQNFSVDSAVLPRSIVETPHEPNTPHASSSRQQASADASAPLRQDNDSPAMSRTDASAPGVGEDTSIRECIDFRGGTYRRIPCPHNAHPEQVQNRVDP